MRRIQEETGIRREPAATYLKAVGIAVRSPRVWAELYEQAFRRLGGSTRTVVLDTLGEGVLKPDIYDPALNPLYRDLLAHYGAVARPYRVRDPDRKGKVERSVGRQEYSTQGPLLREPHGGPSVPRPLETELADTRIHGTTKRQVAAMFAEEKPALLPLPLEPFRGYQFGDRRVNLDGCVEVDAAYYSAPPGWIGRSVKVQWDGRVVRVLDPRSGQLLREHLHQQRGYYRIPEEDRPAHTPRSNCWPLRQDRHARRLLDAYRVTPGMYGVVRRPDPGAGGSTAPTRRAPGSG